MNYENEIQDSIHYLSSEKAIKDLEADSYWPKWDSPWWHMLLLHEMGETKLIPEIFIKKYVTALNKTPLKIFPIFPNDMPEGIDPYRENPCHCQLGNVYQVLAKWGIDVDQELPWIRPWLLRYQMADGGLNCDGDAYLVKDEVPSSMVGTISVFEAILMYTARPWTPEENEFLNKSATFLLKRQLKLSSQTKYNSDENASAEKWPKLCFPRFYFYDVLRGLNAILIWSEKMNRPLPAQDIQDVVINLAEKFHDGLVSNERLSYEGVRTILQSTTGEWDRRQPPSFFPLLTKVSAIGEMSPFLTKQWAEVRTRISRHEDLKNLI